MPPDNNDANTADMEVSLPAPMSVDSWLDRWTPVQIAKMQDDDSVIKQVKQWKTSSADKPSKEQTFCISGNVRTYLTHWDELEIENGILYRMWQPPQSIAPCMQLVAPIAMRKFIFEQLHCSRTAGHFGVSRTVSLVRSKFFWPRYRDDIDRWCRKCDVCAAVKPGPRRTGATLQQSIASAPMERIAIDIAGPFATTQNGNTYIMVVCDYFTKWTEAYAIPNHTAQTVADKLVVEFIARFGIPMTIHSDKGAEFTSQLFESLCSLLGAKKTATNPYRPQSDGLVERANRTIKQMLKCFTHQARTDWDDHLPYLMIAYRSSTQESTQCTPNLLMLGREVNLPVDLMFQRRDDPQNPSCPQAYVEWVKAAMQEAYEFVQGNLKRSAIRQKRLYDRGKVTRRCKVGDWVWRMIPPREKLGITWHGPYLITARIGDLSYAIQKARNARKFTAHIDHLKPYEGDDAPDNWLEADNPVIEAPAAEEPTLGLTDLFQPETVEHDDEASQEAVDQEIEFREEGEDQNFDDVPSAADEPELNRRKHQRIRKPNINPDFHYY